jgi:hypothetical protein
MQHPDETSEILETYVCNMRFQRNVTMHLGGMEEARCEALCWRGGRRRHMELAGAAMTWATAGGVASHKAPPSARGMVASATP